MAETAVPFDFNITVPTLGKTYLVRADGTANAKEDACVETAGANFATASTCLDMAAVNAETFSPGDRVMFSAEGGNYTETLVVPSSGTLGQEIIYAGVLGGVELPQIVIPNGQADECIEIEGKSNIRIANFDLTGGGAGQGVFIWTSGSNQVRNCFLSNIHVLKNHNGATQGAANAADDAFSINGDSTVEMFNISASNVNDNSTGSDQCLTTHDASQVTVTGFHFQDSNNAVVAVGTSSCTVKNGYMRGITVGFGDNGAGNTSTVVFERCVFECDGAGKLPRGTGANGVTCTNCDFILSGSSASTTLPSGLTTFTGCRFKIGAANTARYQTFAAAAIIRATDCSFDCEGGKINGFIFDADVGGAIQFTRCDFFGAPATTDQALVRFSNAASDVSQNSSFLTNCIFAVENNDRQVWVRFDTEQNLSITKCTFAQLAQSDKAIENDGTVGTGTITITDCGFVNFSTALDDASSGNMISASSNAAHNCGGTSGLGALVTTDNPRLYGPTNAWLAVASDGGNIGAE